MSENDGREKSRTEHGKREVAVTHHFMTEIDVDRLEEFVEANFPEGQTQIIDVKTREALYDDI